MKSFTKVVRVGQIQTYDGLASVFVEIKWTGEKLSLHGVEGPLRNGNARGACGQISLPEEFTTFADGWDEDKAKMLWKTWKRWHLNDMRPGCEHQQAENWGKEELQVVTFRLTHGITAQQRKIEQTAEKALKRGEQVKYTDEELKLVNLPWEVKASYETAPDDEYYVVERAEKKTAGWVRPEEHPKGVLCKPCPVCGYKYGSGWRHEDVPTEVLEWLKSLPDADKKPAWV